MKRGEQDYPDPDDMFADTRMTFGEHIEDLRTHLFRAIYGFLLGFVIAIPLGGPVLRFIAAPVEKQLLAYHRRYDDARIREITAAMKDGNLAEIAPVQVEILFDAREFASLLRPHLKLPAEEAPKKVDEEPQYIKLTGKVANPLEYVNQMHKVRQLIHPPQLTTLSVQEAFMVLFKVIMMTGLVIASPWVFFQIWSFIAAGLYPQEKRLVNVYLPFSIGLFLIGVFVCEFFVIPKAVEAMLWFNEFLGFQPDLRLSEWLGFAIFMPLVFGISFQTPLVMFFMERIGIGSVQGYKEKRRLAWFCLAIFAAVITPSTDAFSMLFLWVPMSMLYEAGIWLCILSPRPPEEEWETSESEEMIEV